MFRKPGPNEEQENTTDERGRSQQNRSWITYVLPGALLILTGVVLLNTESVPLHTWIHFHSAEEASTSASTKGTPRKKPEIPSSYRRMDPPPATSSTRKRGKQLYEQNCSVCHGIDGSGNGPVSEALTPDPQSFKDTGFVERHTDRYLFWRISEGKRGTPMPSFKQTLSRQERWCVVHYLHALSDTISNNR